MEWLDKSKINLASAKVEVEVEAKLGNIPHETRLMLFSKAFKKREKSTNLGFWFNHR